MTENLAALTNSAARLRQLVDAMSPEQVRQQAYPSEWTVADVVSHVATGGVIMGDRLEAGLTDREVADDFAPAVRDEWNAKSPDAQVADGLAADGALIDRLTALTEAERAPLRMPFGPMELDFESFVGMRLNEHALHTWDIEVIEDPAATVPTDAVRFVVDNLSMIVGFVGKPTGVVHDVHIRTTDPERDFTLSLGTDWVTLSPASAPATGAVADLELPAEAFVRLVYGRLDPEHTPAVKGSADLAELRRAFPGI